MQQTAGLGSSLTYLEIADSSLKIMPDALVRQTSIRRFSLNMNDFEVLPAGPHLEHLTLLDLWNNPSLQYPEAVSMASLLQVLRLCDGEPWADMARLRATLPEKCSFETQV